MMKSTALIAPAVAIATALVAQSAAAITVTRTLTYSVQNQSLFGSGSGAGVNVGAPINLPGAVANIGGSANSGDVDAFVRQNVTAEFDGTVALSTAGSTAVRLEAVRGSGSTRSRADFDTVIGADAQANIDPNPFLGFNIGPIGLDEDYQLTTEASVGGLIGVNTLGRTLTDADSQALTGVSLPSIPVGITVEAGIDLDARQSASFEIDSLQGFVRAVHSGGTVRFSAFGLETFTSLSLDLDLVGDWTLSLFDVALEHNFQTTFGLGGTAFLGLGVGIFCGDTSDPDDNFGCAGEFYNSVSTPSLNLLSFDNELNFNSLSTTLGSITVLDDTPQPPAPVPLPAGLPLMVAGLGTLVLLRRRRAT